MSNYKRSFDAHAVEANSATTNKHTALVGSNPSIHPTHIRRLLTNISKLLGHVDEERVKHPEYLAGSPTSVPERAIQLVSNVQTSLESGVEPFLTSTLPALVDVEDRLARAVGVDAYNVKQIKNLQIRALEQIVDRADVDARTVRGGAENTKKEREEIRGALEQIKIILDQANEDKKKIEDVRSLADKLARGNSSQNPLEKMVRDARDKFDEISNLTDKAAKSASVAQQSADSAANNKINSDVEFSKLSATNVEADQILRNATQAGLAGAYKIERDRLSKEQTRYAVAFYGEVALIIIYAAVFIVPVFSHILERGDSAQAKLGESALLLLVRIAILAPAIWALIFTNRRHGNLEILQMDYAAKAATALAYSGYRSEMDGDTQLSNKLKNGLVIRFLEHPERLLHKNTIKEQIGFGKDGLSYSSTVTPPDEPIPTPKVGGDD